MACKYGVPMKKNLTNYMMCSIDNRPCTFCRYCTKEQSIVFNGLEVGCTKHRDYEAIQLNKK
ncbi:MAG: hypothetical protein ACRCX8_03425 [Sarcina sp.]